MTLPGHLRFYVVTGHLDSRVTDDWTSPAGFADERSAYCAASSMSSSLGGPGL
ncbi:MAG TPA: hypothetical protein VF983_06270 [Streptosporangiaceae bacterium]